jgi:hypothetical protein
MDSNWVVEVIMGGTKVNAEVKTQLNEIFRLLRDKKFHEAEQSALALRGRIGNSEDLQRAISMIDRVKVLGR